MLRQIYFLSLLLCINITFSYDYLLKEELDFKPGSRKNSGRRGKGKIIRNRDYEMFYDKKPIAHIDVADFIQSPDESSVDHLQTDDEPAEKEFKIQGSHSDNYDSLVHINNEIIRDDSQNLESNIVPEINILNSKTFIPRREMSLDGLSLDEINSPNIGTHKSDLLKRNRDDYSFETKIGHISRTEKKCALKDMKIPFFSRDKAESTTGKKNKKRKLFNFRKSNKQTKSHSTVTEHSLVNNNIKSTENPQVFNKINKRSYYEKLCPACREKFFVNSDMNSDRTQKNSNNIIHNSRQYYQRKQYIYPKSENFEKPYNSEIKRNGLNNNYVKERRWRRNDETIEEKQKKVLEEIEKKVDSVKVNNQIN